MRISDWSSDVCSSDLGAGLDDLLERLVGIVGAFDQLVGLAHVGLVVLAVMEAQRLRRAVRLQRVLRIGQGGKLERHAVSLSISLRSNQYPALGEPVRRSEAHRVGTEAALSGT